MQMCIFTLRNSAVELSRDQAGHMITFICEEPAPLLWIIRTWLAQNQSLFYFNIMVSIEHSVYDIKALSIAIINLFRFIQTKIYALFVI